jgi:hypothetical protein
LNPAALKRNISKLQTRLFRIAIRTPAVNPSANVLPAASRHPN